LVCCAEHQQDIVDNSVDTIWFPIRAAAEPLTVFVWLLFHFCSHASSGKMLSRWQLGLDFAE
jgi:hypothetical protein